MSDSEPKLQYIGDGHGESKHDKRKKKKKNRTKKRKSSEDENIVSRTPLKKSTSEKQYQPPSSKEPALQPGSHPFEVDDSDHCETPLRAYQDLVVVLDQLLVDKNKTNKNPKRPRSSLRIYDPYYCDGGVKLKLASLGFTNVINENRDFYQDVQDGKIPDYDVLVTNPPYSGQHMEKLLDFCVAQQNQKAKPSFLLLPHFVYTKDYYARALSPIKSPKATFFSFLVPSIRYSYVPPAWVANRSGASLALAKGKGTTAPFPSFWYCCHLQGVIDTVWFQETFGASGSIRSQHKSGLRYARYATDIPRDFKGEFDPTKKRPNPRARKRMRLAAMAAANGGQPALSQEQQKREKGQQQQPRNPKKKKKKRY